MLTGQLDEISVPQLVFARVTGIYVDTPVTALDSFVGRIFGCLDLKGGSLFMKLITQFSGFGMVDIPGCHKDDSVIFTGTFGRNISRDNIATDLV